MSNWIKESFSFFDLQRIIFRLIERVPVFRGLSQQELLDLLESAEKCTFEEGETIIRQGSTGAFLYILVEGKVSVQKSLPQQPATELAQLLPGDSFGEMSLIDSDTRSATVIALKHSVMIRLNESSCWENPTISAKIFRNIARVLSTRLRDMDHAFLLGKQNSEN